MWGSAEELSRSLGIPIQRARDVKLKLEAAARARADLVASLDPANFDASVLSAGLDSISKDLAERLTALVGREGYEALKAGSAA